MNTDTMHDTAIRVLAAYDEIVRHNASPDLDTIYAVAYDTGGEVYYEVLDTARDLGVAVDDDPDLIDVICNATLDYRARLRAEIAARPPTDPDEDENVDVCPEHGPQRVTGYGATRGADPYGISKLACGHDVICLGPGDENLIVGTSRRVVCVNRLPWARA
jgi:hypothetical protein